MFKSITEFLVTGFAVVISYALYFVIALIMTVLIGLPIGFGIKLIYDAVKSFFVGGW